MMKMRWIQPLHGVAIIFMVIVVFGGNLIFTCASGCNITKAWLIIWFTDGWNITYDVNIFTYYVILMMNKDASLKKK